LRRGAAGRISANWPRGARADGISCLQPKPTSVRVWPRGEVGMHALDSNTFMIVFALALVVMGAVVVWLTLRAKNQP
jgi:hypothetical protein